jgi:hypothetical protein
LLIVSCPSRAPARSITSALNVMPIAEYNKPSPWTEYDGIRKNDHKNGESDETGNQDNHRECGRLGRLSCIHHKVDDLIGRSEIG